MGVDGIRFLQTAETMASNLGDLCHESDNKAFVVLATDGKGLIRAVKGETGDVCNLFVNLMKRDPEMKKVLKVAMKYMEARANELQS